MRIFKKKYNKQEVSRLSDKYRRMILSHKEVELISKSDYENLIKVAKYADFGVSTAIQSAFYLGYVAGKDGAENE